MNSVVILYEQLIKMPMKTLLIFLAFTSATFIRGDGGNIMDSNAWSGILAMIVVLILCYNLINQRRNPNWKSRFTHSHNHKPFIDGYTNRFGLL